MFTAVYFEGHDGWLVGYVKELPGAYGQGRDLSDLLKNLRDARELVLRQIARENEENFVGLREIGSVDLDQPVSPEDQCPIGDKAASPAPDRR